MSVEEKLRLMQKQLLELVNLTGATDQIQATIEMVTKALQQFLPQETGVAPTENKTGDELKDEFSDQEYDDSEETKDHFSEPEYEPDKVVDEISNTSDYSFNSTREPSAFSEKYSNDGHFGNSCDSSGEESEEYTKDVNEKSEENFENHEMNEEELKIKQEKQLKIKTLEKSWQRLCETEKRVYK